MKKNIYAFITVLFFHSTVFGFGCMFSRGGMNALRDGEVSNTLKFVQSMAKTENLDISRRVSFQIIDSTPVTSFLGASKQIVSDPIDFMQKHIKKIDIPVVETELEKTIQAERFNKLFSVKQVFVDIDRTSCNKIADTSVLTKQHAVSAQVWNPLVEGFVENNTIVSGQFAGQRLKQALDTLKLSCNGVPGVIYGTFERSLPKECAKLFGGLAVYGATLVAGLKSLSNYQFSQEDQKNVQNQDQLVVLQKLDPIKVTIGLCATTLGLVGGKILYNRFHNRHLRINQLKKQAGSSQQMLISLLRKHGYTKSTVKITDLVKLGLNARQAAYIISYLDA